MPRLSAALRLFAVCVALLLAACAAPVSAPPPMEGDCAVVRVWSNGWHTAIALPAEALEETHPARALFPQARYFLIGWGERDFYRNRSPGFVDGARAIFPGPSTMLVIAANEPVEARIWPALEMTDVAVSGAGLRRLTEGIADSFVLDGSGAPQVIQEGHVPGMSVFVEARGSFHLFKMCNHWTAARLREGGVRVNPRLAFHAPGLTAAVRRAAPQACLGLRR
ncbi:MAG: DUF2459 domain-containing protein [Maricaulaceae bacterium]|nr:DUF2459 domain-containing protein [Maricaulaceae bacterium]